jgi:DNA-binding transcriptional MerR regulator
VIQDTHIPVGRFSVSPGQAQRVPIAILGRHWRNRVCGVRASRIRYYEAIGVLPTPERVSGRRRYTPDVLRRLTVIIAAQRIGFTLEEIRQLLGPGRRPAHERLRVLAIDKLPEIEELIHHAVTVQQLLITCAACDCDSLDECRILDDALKLSDHPPHASLPPRRRHAQEITARN